MMAQVSPPAKKLPRYKGTVVCQSCGAEYTPGNWVIVVYEKGTGNDFHPIGSLEKGRCPICRRPEES